MEHRVRAFLVLTIIVASCTPAPSPGPTAPSPTQIALATPVPTNSSTPQPSEPPPASPEPTLGPGGDVRFDLALDRPIDSGFSNPAVGWDGGFVLTGEEGDPDAAEASRGATFMVLGSADGATWRSVATDDFKKNLYALAHGPAGWVAWIDTPRDTGFQVVFSADGLRWDIVPGPTDWATSIASGVSASDAGYVLFGQLGASGDYAQTVWFSADGRDWHEATQARKLMLDNVIAFPGAYVGVSYEGTYISRDGATWSKLARGADAAFTAYGDGRIVFDGSGRIMALADGRPDDPVRVWAGSLTDTNPPSLTWRRLQQAETVLANVHLATAVGSPAGGFLILGFDSRFQPLAVTSPDGEMWTTSDLDPGAFGGGVPNDVAANRDGYVATGWSLGSAGHSGTSLWRSPDGISWAPTGEGIFAPPAPAVTGPCPVDTSTLVTDYPHFAPELLPACLGSAPIKVTGYIGGCGGCGGIGSEYSTVEWLYSSFGGAPDFWLLPRRHRSVNFYSYGKGLPVHLKPGIPHPRGIRNLLGAKISVTGHFDDPASERCRLLPIDGVIEGLAPAELFVELCRQSFVATEIKLLER